MRDKKYGFVDKNKYFKKNIAESMKSFAEVVDKSLNSEKREGFHELRRAYTDILSKKSYYFN